MKAVRIAFLIILLGPVGCASWEHTPIDIPEALSFVQTQTAGDVTVSVAILNSEEAAQHLGIDLDESELQAVWLRVRNASEANFWLLRSVMDLDVYSPDEIASMYESQFNKNDYAALLQHLRDQSMQVNIPAQTMSEGLVFVPKAYGGRYVDVRLVQDVYDVTQAEISAQARGETVEKALDLELRFEYTIPLPDGMFDFEDLNEARIYVKSIPEINSLDDLRTTLTQLPCCSRNEAGDEDGDPLNIVMIGSGSNILHSLARAGWSFTHRINLESVTRLIGASLSNQPYPVAPVSDLFLFGRKQDFALQRPRPRISQRNHMRLWLAPFRYREHPVWVGQISRDIGIKLTPKSPSLTTHVIDPDVDLAREYLLDTLLAGGFVDAFGFVAGSASASRENPASNLVDDTYFSDGKRLVILLTPYPKPYRDVRSLLWERSDAPIREAQSPAADNSTAPLRGSTVK